MELPSAIPRSEKALLSALTEMCATSTVKAVTEELVGHAFSATSIPGIVKRLDGELGRFMKRQLSEPFAFLIVDAPYEKVRCG